MDVYVGAFEKDYGKISSFACSDVGWQCFNPSGKGET